MPANRSAPVGLRKNILGEQPYYRALKINSFYVLQKLTIKEIILKIPGKESS